MVSESIQLRVVFPSNAMHHEAHVHAAKHQIREGEAPRIQTQDLIH